MNLFNILLICSLVALSLAVKFSLDTISEMPMLLKEGKQQLDLLTANSRAPQYGECWSSAVSNLQTGCRSLTQELQSALALRLTDCFLQMSGQGPIACEAPRKECLHRLSDREFNAYTEFYTHTQNICYFLQSKLWHEQSEITIDRLSATSFKVSQQLAEAEKGQEALLQQQRESLEIQEDMSRHMELSKDTMNAMMTDLRTSALEQQLALSSLFQQLSTLQSWAVGELSWLDSIIFYLSAAILSCIFTSTARTHRARLPIMTVLTLNYALERYWCSFISNSNSSESVVDISASINAWVWFFRKVTIAICIGALVIVALTYWDYNAIIYQTLVQIKKQNAEMRELLRQNRGADFVDYVAKHLEPEMFPSEQCSRINNSPDSSCPRVERDRSRKSISPNVFTDRSVLSRPASRNKSMTPLHVEKAYDDQIPVGRDSYCETISESHPRFVRRSSRLQKVEKHVLSDV